MLDRLAGDDPRVRVFHFDRHYGQSSAVDARFKHSVGALIITIDGDLQNDPAVIGTLFPYVKTFRIHDTGCSLKIFRRAVVDRLQLFNGLHRSFPALALMHGFTPIEVPVHHCPRTYGLSKYGVGNRLFKGLYDLIAVRWRQIRVLRDTFRD